MCFIDVSLLVYVVQVCMRLVAAPVSYMREGNTRGLVITSPQSTTHNLSSVNNTRFFQHKITRNTSLLYELEPMTAFKNALTNIYSGSGAQHVFGGKSKQAFWRQTRCAPEPVC